jgi:hypothetical protein
MRTLACLLVFSTLALGQSQGTANARRIQGRLVTTAPPTIGHFLKWDGTQIVWDAAAGGSGSGIAELQSDDGTVIGSSFIKLRFLNDPYITVNVLDAGSGLGTVQFTPDTSAFNLLYPQLAAPNTYAAGAKSVFTPDATTAGIRIAAGIPTAQAGGDLCITPGGQFCHFDGTNIRLALGIVGSGTTVPATPTTGNLMAWGGTFSATDSGVSPQAAGSAGTNPINAGTSTELARKDHEHRVPWQAGLGFEASPPAAEFAIPIPVSNQCGGSIDAVSISITALTKGSSTLTFNVIRYNAAGASQGNLFSATQTYSNSGDNRQSFTVNQNGTGIAATDYFRPNFITVNGQDDFTFTVQGKCKNVV